MTLSNATLLLKVIFKGIATMYDVLQKSSFFRQLGQKRVYNAVTAIHDGKFDNLTSIIDDSAAKNLKERASIRETWLIQADGLKK